METLFQDPKGFQVLLEIQVHLGRKVLKEREDTREGLGPWAYLADWDLRGPLDTLERRATLVRQSLVWV